MRIYTLSKSARTLFFDKVSTLFRSTDFETISSKARDLKIAELDTESFAIIFDRDTNLYFGRKTSDDYFPLLKDEVVVPSLSVATVDSGAVKFVCNGANVMRPGIVSFSGDFARGDIITVKEIAHSKAIAIGRALEGRLNIEGMKKGPSVENLHYIGDKFWESLKGLIS
jgi:malignant T-cell-amplified sequence